MNNQKLEKWIRWLDHINPEIYYLLENRKIFRLLVKEHNAGKMLNPTWSFVKGNYAGNMTMCVSRQVDADPQAVSLFKLLNDLLKNASMITKEWFVTNYSEATGESTFKTLFGDHDCVQTKLIEDDIHRIKDKATAIKDHRDKRVAHSDKNQQIPKEPEFKDIDDCVDLFEEIFNRYYYLLKQSSHQYPVM